MFPSMCTFNSRTAIFAQGTFGFVTQQIMAFDIVHFCKDVTNSEQTEPIIPNLGVSMSIACTCSIYAPPPSCGLFDSFDESSVKCI